MIGYFEGIDTVVLGVLCAFLWHRLNVLQKEFEEKARSLNDLLDDKIELGLIDAVDEIRESLNDALPDLDQFEILELRKQEMIGGLMGKAVEYFSNRLNMNMGVHQIEEPATINNPELEDTIHAKEE